MSFNFRLGICTGLWMEWNLQLFWMMGWGGAPAHAKSFYPRSFHSFLSFISYPLTLSFLKDINFSRLQDKMNYIYKSNWKCFELGLLSFPNPHYCILPWAAWRWSLLSEQAEASTRYSMIHVFSIYKAKTWPHFPLTSTLTHFFPLTLSGGKEKEMEKFWLRSSIPYLKRTAFPLALVFGMFPPATNAEERWLGHSLGQCFFTDFPWTLSRSVSPHLPGVPGHPALWYLSPSSSCSTWWAFQTCN